jgi:hypothetical protein
MFLNGLQFAAMISKIMYCDHILRIQPIKLAQNKMIDYVFHFQENYINHVNQLD